MDGKAIRNKLVGSDDERAVSPVIGVILMVAITVILAAVIATLVMDFGDSTESPINAQVASEVASSDSEVELSVTEPGEASSFVLRGEGLNEGHSDVNNGEADLSGDGNLSALNAETGGVLVLDDSGDSEDLFDGGTVNIVAIDGDREESAGSFEADDWT